MPEIMQADAVQLSTVEDGLEVTGRKVLGIHRGTFVGGEYKTLVLRIAPGSFYLPRGLPRSL
jgi:hypothetical protein